LIQVDEKPKRSRRDEADFLERLAELDRNLASSDHAEGAAAIDAWAEFAERRPSSNVPPKGMRPLLDLFPPVAPASDSQPQAAVPPPERDDAAGEPWNEPADDDIDLMASPVRVAGLLVVLLLLVAAGATAAAYVFRDDLAAILTAWL
jgi:hypothetical protein